MVNTNQIEMELGAYRIPDSRLNPSVREDIKKIYDIIRNTVDAIEYTDIAKIFGYSKPNTGAFYRRLNSLSSYGMLEGVSRGKFRITELGENISYPPSDEIKKQSFKQAVLNVPLWNELYKKYGKNIGESIWLDLKTITGISSPEAQAVEKEIRRWYFEDVNLISEELLETRQQQEQSLSLTESNSTHDKHMTGTGVTMMSDHEGMNRINFENMAVLLPKQNLRKSWELLQKYMEVYLESHKEELDATKDNRKDNSSVPHVDN